MNTRYADYAFRVDQRVRESQTLCAAAKVPPLNMAFSDSMITERMMRCGIEARAFGADNEDDVRTIAILTLRDEAARYVNQHIALYG